MSSEHPPPSGHRTSFSRAVRRHLVLVAVCVVQGAVIGLLYAASLPATYTSTARVLVNPSVGNPFVPTPTAVRQDELTSLETEAEVARSVEVLGTVAEGTLPQTATQLARGLQVVVPPNTQILQISYSSADAALAQRTVDVVANAYLDNRTRRFDEVNSARIERLQTQTDHVVNDLRTATAAAQTGSAADRMFQAQLATALRNDLVSLRAQRTALETSETPAGAVISPATVPQTPTDLVAMAAPVGGALLGLAVGCLLAALLERARGVVRSAAEVEEAGLPVAATVPARRGRPTRFSRPDPAAVETTIRRLRSSILDLDPRPDIVTVAPAGSGESDADISEALAGSFARGGHRVVLVRTDGQPPASALVRQEGWADALLYERLAVQELLQPSVEPLLCVLPGGFTAESRELLVADRVRAVLAPLVGAGNLVVIQSPGIDSAEGEALVGAADLGIVVVTTDQTPLSALHQVAQRRGAGRPPVAALVLGSRDTAHPSWLTATDGDLVATHAETAPRRALTRDRR